MNMLAILFVFALSAEHPEAVRLRADTAPVSFVRSVRPLEHRSLGEGAQPDLHEVVAEIRIQGNVLTPDEQVRELAGITPGMTLTSDTPSDVAERLRATRRFKHVDVLKRFASISDPTKIVLVVIVDEGSVKIESGGNPGAPAYVVRRQGLQLMYLPLIHFEDGYGFSYGVRVSRPGPFGRRSRLSFPLTWGGDKRAAVQVDKNFVSGPVDRLDAGASVSRRRHPFFEQQDDRRRLWLTAERELVSSLRGSATAAWQHVAFLDEEEGFAQMGAELVFDTRLDRMLPRNAIYARAGWERSNVPDGAVNQTTLDARGYVGLPARSVLVVRALREDADGPVPPYLKSMLGGMPNLRGFRRGTAVGDTLVAGSVEVRLPLTSPLRVGQIGVSAFFDAGKTYDTGQRFANQKLERAIGGGVWFSAAFLRLNVAVAHGIGGSTRVHVSTGVSP